MAREMHGAMRMRCFLSFITLLYAANSCYASNELCSDESVKFAGTGDMYVIAAITLPPGIPLSGCIREISAQQQEIARICCAYGLSFGSASEYNGAGKPPSLYYSLEVKTGDSLIATKIKNDFKAEIARDTEGYYDYAWMASIGNLRGKKAADALATRLKKMNIPDDNISTSDMSVLLIFGRQLSQKNAADLAGKLTKLGVKSLTVRLEYSESDG